MSYIEREAAVNGLAKIINESDMPEDWNKGMSAAMSALFRIPAADVRPVVLCRDCKWTKTDEIDDPAIYCMQWDRWETPPDGFCWLGEKREES